MKSAKTLLIALLVLTTVGGIFIAWRQNQELTELRAAAMNREERADLQKKVWDLQRANRDLEARLASRRGGAPLEPADGAAPAPGADERGRGGRGGPREAIAFRQLMNKPEFQALLTSQQKSTLDRTYAALFRTLNLSPEQTERLKNLLVEKQNTALDVLEAARAQGIDPRDNPEEFQKFLQNARNEVDAAIRSAIGDAAFAQLQTFEQTLPQRGVVGELQQRLAYSGNSLSIEQENQLVQILAANQPARSLTTGSPNPPGGAAGAIGPMTGLRGEIVGAFVGGPGVGLANAVLGGPTVPITNQAVAQAQTVLTAPQLTALQQLQQQQQAQQQIRQMVNEATGNQPGRGPDTALPRPRAPGGK